MAEVVCVVPTGDWTGEGILWHAAEKALYWTDIGRQLAHRYDPATGAVRTWFFDEPVTTLALTDRSDTLIVALGSRLVLWQPANDARADFANPSRDWPGVRSNDGQADPAGNFWFGTMRFEAEEQKPMGRVFRVRGDGSSSIQRTGISIANTFVWSPDGNTFYNADSDANAIHAFDFDIRTGDISNERPFFVGFDRGVPDGSAIDRDGYLWNTRYDGACVVRLSPQGKIDRVVEVPTAAVTNCTFGGPQLKTLYLTSGGGNKGGATGDRFAGGLFALEVDVPGAPENRFRLRT